MVWVVGVDVGGTFTDFFAVDPETGELIDGVGWMNQVRKQRHPELAED